MNNPQWDIVNGANLNESEIRLSLPAGVRSGLDKMNRELVNLLHPQGNAPRMQVNL